MATAFEPSAFDSGGFESIPTIYPTGWQSSQVGTPLLTYDQYPVPTGWQSSQFGSPLVTETQEVFISGFANATQFGTGQIPKQRLITSSTNPTRQYLHSLTFTNLGVAYLNAPRHTSGKWYLEISRVTSSSSSINFGFLKGNATSFSSSNGDYIIFNSGTSTSRILHAGALSSLHSVLIPNLMAFAIDLDNGLWYFATYSGSVRTWMTLSMSGYDGGEPGVGTGWPIEDYVNNGGIKFAIQVPGSSNSYIAQPSYKWVQPIPAGFSAYEPDQPTFATASPLINSAFFGTLEIIARESNYIGAFGIPSATLFGQLQTTMVAYQDGLLNEQEFGQLLTSMLVQCQSIDYTGVVSDIRYIKNRVDVVANTTVVLTGPDETVVVEIAEF